MENQFPPIEGDMPDYSGIALVFSAIFAMGMIIYVFIQ
jgi:hypothetical protein